MYVTLKRNYNKVSFGLFYVLVIINENVSNFFCVCLIRTQTPTTMKMRQRVTNSVNSRTMHEQSSLMTFL